MARTFSAPQVVRAIDRFVPEDTPLGRYDEGRMLLRASGNNPVLALMFAAKSRKESEFGRTAFQPHNFIGWNIHGGGMRASSPEAIFRTAAQFIRKPGSPYSGTTTALDITDVWAPPVENNTGLYKSQERGWMEGMVRGSSSAPWRGAKLGGRVPPGGGGRGGASVPPGRGSSTTLQPVPLPADATRRIDEYLAASHEAVYTPTYGDLPDVRPLVDYIGSLPSFREVRVPGAPTGTPGPSRRAASTPAGEVQLRPHGEWQGTAGPIISLTALAEKQGLQVTSRKRDQPSPVAGTRSDHYIGNKNAYAHDIGWGGSRPTPASDRAASAIVAALGGPRNWGGSGGVYENVINGIRYQVIYRSNVGGNHWNHIHMGARRVGG